MPIVDRGIQVGLGSFIQGIEGSAVVSDLYSKHVCFRCQCDLELVETFIMSVVHDVKPELLEYQVYAEDELGRPVLPLADVFHGSGYLLQLTRAGLKLQLELFAQLSVPLW